MRLIRFWAIRLRIILGTIPVLGLAYFDPAQFLPIPSGFQRLINFGASAAISIWLIRRFAPTALPLLKRPIFHIRFVISIMFSVFMISTLLGGLHIYERDNWSIIGGVLAALGVGITEELFCRGFVLGAFVHLGMWRAALGSSLYFGFLHFSNWIAGSGFGPTAGQVISASGFGFFAAGITIFSRSIYPAILIHAAVDIPSMLVNSKGYEKVLVKGEFVNSLHLALWWTVLGLVFMVGASRFTAIEPILRKWKLVESEE